MTCNYPDMTTRKKATVQEIIDKRQTTTFECFEWNSAASSSGSSLCQSLSMSSDFFNEGEPVYIM